MKTLALMGICACMTLAQTSPSCDEEHKGQFDFWIGHWEVFDHTGKKVGENVIESRFDGCVLQENWTSSDSFSNGTSLNFFNPQKEKWEQFWVYHNGTTLHLEGELKGGSMILKGESIGPDGVAIVNRITWTPNDDGSVRQHGEYSVDKGKTFSTGYDGLYKKKT